MSDSKPSSSINVEGSMFYVGQNSRGQWVAQDAAHRRGGLFVNRAEAIKFALFENGRRLRDLVVVPGVLELDLSAPRIVPSQANPLLVQRAA